MLSCRTYIKTSAQKAYRLQRSATAAELRAPHHPQQGSSRWSATGSRLARSNRALSILIIAATKGIPNMPQNGTAVQQSRSRSGLLVAKEMLDDKLSEDGRVSIKSLHSRVKA